MGGKKKKSLANKLSKMSDEDRARYLQHRAEIEEEAKRRKEQLIATFMKKKIKKEDAFSRLNISKINQNWHQILRKIKVKEMKEEVDHLRSWIERLLDYKNRHISKLITQLEEAEEQYLKNFNSHAIHLDKNIENQNEHIQKLQSQYQEELDDFLKQAKKESDLILNRSKSETTYLKTVIFAQGAKATRELQDDWVHYSMQLYEIEHNNRIILQHLRTTRGRTETVLWRQMLQIVRLYVQTTDVRRSHLQELRRMDAESADEIRLNEEKISKEEELVKVLNANYEDILKLRSEKIKSLKAEEKQLSTTFLNIRKTLKLNLALDEKQLRILISESNKSLDHLSQIFDKGKHLLNLSSTCQKFETDREKVSKWMPVPEIIEETIGEVCDVIEEDDAHKKTGMKDEGLTDDEKLYQQALERGFSLPKIVTDLDKQEVKKVLKPRPKTALPSAFIISPTSVKRIENVSTPESIKITPIEKVNIEVKKAEDKTEQESFFPSTSREKQAEPKDFLNDCYKSLEKLEHFWFTYNKVNIDVMELKKEKNHLEKENKQLRGLIRAVLEAAALAKSIPDTRVSTRVHSKRSAYSAPLRRVVFN